MKRIYIALLAGAMLLSVFLNLYQKQNSPPGFTADEAAFGYNAYSLSQTGKDEYGVPFPLRLKSFGDYKMPLYSYLSVPFIGVFGLNETTTRMVNTLLAFFFPLVIFILCKQLFNKISVGIVAAYLVSFSLGLHIVGRHAHEAYLAAFLITCASILFINVLKKPRFLSSSLFFILLLGSLFSYQSSRIYAAYFFFFACIYLIITKKGKYFILSFIGVLLLFGVTDVIYAPSRVQSLLFFNNPGFSLKINEFRSEGGSRLVYNKATVGISELTKQYLAYLSPEFLAIDGDKNYRFGFPGMAPVTPVVYIFFLIGIYYMFKNKERWRYFILGLLLLSPISGSLSWAEVSLTRSLFLVIIIFVFAAYGCIHFVIEQKQKSIGRVAFLVIVITQLFFLFYAWQFYLYHYPKRAIAIRSWQPGYSEIVNYVKTRYDAIDRFYITRKNGQPYIFLLFYLQYPPEKYQKQARLSKPDQAGFGQVETFDKYRFNFTLQNAGSKSIFIGYPDDFSNQLINQSKIKKVNAGTEEIFWIYETQK